MWNKIYPLLLVVSVVVMGVVAYLAYSQLQGIGFAPAKIVASFDTYASAYWGFLAISFLVLLAVGNVILWLFRNSWALWTSLAFFVVFALLKSFWLDKVLFDYEVANSLPASSTFSSYFVAILMCAAVAAIVFFNHFLALRMRDKIHGEPALIDNQAEPILTEKTETIETKVGEEQSAETDKSS
jgi:hypothetical protein